MHVEANICFRANIRFPFSHAGEYSLRNTCFEANINKTSSEIHIQVNISLQILEYKRIFATYFFKLYRNTVDHALPQIPGYLYKCLLQGAKY
jgi:hypothetical protein